MRRTIVVGLAALAGLGSVTGLASPARSATAPDRPDTRRRDNKDPRRFEGFPQMV